MVIMNKTLQTRPFVAALVLALTLALGVAVGALAAGTGNRVSSPAGPLAGAWRMTTLETGTEGNLRPTPYSGQIVFDDSGLVSARAMNPDSGAPDTPYTVNGYEAWPATPSSTPPQDGSPPLSTPLRSATSSDSSSRATSR